MKWLVAKTFDDSCEYKIYTDKNKAERKFDRCVEEYLDWYDIVGYSRSLGYRRITFRMQDANNIRYVDIIFRQLARVPHKLNNQKKRRKTNGKTKSS